MNATIDHPTIAARIIAPRPGYFERLYDVNTGQWNAIRITCQDCGHAEIISLQYLLGQALYDTTHGFACNCELTDYWWTVDTT